MIAAWFRFYGHHDPNCVWIVSCCHFHHFLVDGQQSWNCPFFSIGEGTQEIIAALCVCQKLSLFFNSFCISIHNPYEFITSKPNQKSDITTLSPNDIYKPHEIKISFIYLNIFDKNWGQKGFTLNWT